ncbi:MAG: hypothetical protein AAF609_03465 [Cyanobacteria bacterium P01_C01_bin.120]
MANLFVTSLNSFNHGECLRRARRCYLYKSAGLFRQPPAASRHLPIVNS